MVSKILFGAIAGSAALMLVGCSTVGTSQRVGGSYEVPLTAESWALSARDVGLDGVWNGSVTMKALHGGRQEGTKVIEVDNGLTSFTVIPTRGMSVFQVKSGDVVLGWDSPVKELVNPSNINLVERGGLGWLDGFNEWMVRCGYEFAGHPGEDNGRLLPLHGRIGNIPASKVEVIVDSAPPYRIRVRGLVQEKSFKFVNYDLTLEVSTEPGSTVVYMDDTLKNNSDYATEYQVLYHGNYGTTILEEGAQFVGAVKEVSPFDDYAAKDMDTWKRYLGPTPKYGEQVYCIVPYADASGRSTSMLHNKAANRGVAVSFNVKELPHFTLWKNTDTKADGYVTGLEPGTGYAYNRSVERRYGRVPKIGGGETRNFSTSYEILADSASVATAKAQIAAIQGGRSTKTNAGPTTQK